MTRSASKNGNKSGWRRRDAEVRSQMRSGARHNRMKKFFRAWASWAPALPLGEQAEVVNEREVFESMSVEHLRAECQRAGIKTTTKMRKGALIDLLTAPREVSV